MSLHVPCGCGQPTQRFAGHSATVRDLAFSPQGNMVLSGSSDNDVILWDRASGQPIRHFAGHTGLIRSVAFSPDGKTALSASADKTVRQWRIDSLPNKSATIGWSRSTAQRRSAAAETIFNPVCRFLPGRAKNDTQAIRRIGAGGILQR